MPVPVENEAMLPLDLAKNTSPQCAGPDLILNWFNLGRYTAGTIG